MFATACFTIKRIYCYLMLEGFTLTFTCLKRLAYICRSPKQMKMSFVRGKDFISCDLTWHLSYLAPISKSVPLCYFTSFIH